MLLLGSLRKTRPAKCEKMQQCYVLFVVCHRVVKDNSFSLKNMCEHVTMRNFYLLFFHSSEYYFTRALFGYSNWRKYVLFMKIQHNSLPCSNEDYFLFLVKLLFGFSADTLVSPKTGEIICFFS